MDYTPCIVIIVLSVIGIAAILINEWRQNRK